MPCLQNRLIYIDRGCVIKIPSRIKFSSRWQFIQQLISLSHLQVRFILYLLCYALTIHPLVDLFVLFRALCCVHGQGKGVPMLDTGIRSLLYLRFSPPSLPSCSFNNQLLAK